MSKEEFDEYLARLKDDADTFRQAVESVRYGGCSYNDTWAMVPVAKAKEAGLI